MRRYVVATATLCILASSLAFSQSCNFQLGGVVTNLGGGLLSGVTITVTNADTSADHTTIAK